MPARDDLEAQDLFEVALAHQVLGEQGASEVFLETVFDGLERSNGHGCL